jgi:hypothetical protein
MTGIHRFIQKFAVTGLSKPQKATLIPALFYELAQINHSADFLSKSAEQVLLMEPQHLLLLRLGEAFELDLKQQVKHPSR